MEIDEMWDEFKKSRSIKKTSIAEKLDTIAAQNNEIQTDLARVSQLVPKLLGDDAAIEASNAQNPMVPPDMGAPMDMGGMGGAPPTEGAIPGAEEMGPGGMDLGASGGMPDTDESLMGAPAPDEDVPEGAPMPGEGMPEGAPAPDDDIPPMDEEGLGEGALGEGIPTDDTGMPPIEDSAIEPEPMMDEMEGGNGTVDALRNLLHEKVDEGDMRSVKALAEAIEVLEGGADGMGEGFDDYEPMVPETEPIQLSVRKNAAGLDTPAVSDIQPVQQSADAPKSIAEEVIDILNKAEVEIAETLNGTDENAEDMPEGEGEVEIQIETDAEPEEAEDEKAPESGEDEEDDGPKAELSEEGEAPFEESCADNMDASMPMKPKSIQELGFKEILEARMNGQDLIAERVQKSAGETSGYNEFDPWGLTRRSEMFAKADLESAGSSGALSTKKSETVADEVDCPKSVMSGKHDGTDSATVADDIKEPMDHTKGSAPGGDMIDDVDEEKSESEHSVKEGTVLDDVDEKKGTSDHDVDSKDLLDDIDEKKGTSDHKAEGKDLLDDVDEMKKSAADTGVPVMSMRDLMAIKKTTGPVVSRPESVATFGGDYERPSLGKLQKSTAPEPVRMGRGVDPHKVVEADWAEYNLYKAQLGL